MLEKEGGNMRLKAVSGIVLTLLLISILLSAFDIQPVTRARAVPAHEGLEPIFTTGMKIQANGQDIKIDVKTPFLSTFVVDWNNDGKKDLLLGTYSPAYVYLLLNIGTDASPTFEEGTKVKVGEEDIQAIMGANPFVVDWDNDGKKDLLLGDFNLVHLYRNVGTDSSPQFISRSTVLVLNGEGGSYAQPFVVDWNNDGKKDLLIGRSGELDQSYINLYINIGTDASPTFASPIHIQAD